MTPNNHCSVVNCKNRRTKFVFVSLVFVCFAFVAIVKNNYKSARPPLGGHEEVHTIIEGIAHEQSGPTIYTVVVIQFVIRL